MLASVTFTFVLMTGLLLQSTSSAHAEDCITKPNSPAPQGEHWYYRIDHANNRQCWRLGPEGLRVQKDAPQAAAPIARAAAAQPAEPPRRPETTGASTATAARGETAPEPKPASVAPPLPFLDTPRMPDLPPSVLPAPQTQPAGRLQTASALDTVPVTDNSASTNASDTPAIDSVAEPPRQAVTRSSTPPPPVSASGMEIDHTFAFLMIVFAVLAVAGPSLHYAERRRREANHESPRWARAVSLNTPAAPSPRVPLQPNLAAEKPLPPLPPLPPIPPTPIDQTERLAQALQQLVDRLHSQPGIEPGAAATRAEPRANIETIRRRSIAS
jgi:hypothetical protein